MMNTVLQKQAMSVMGEKGSILDRRVRERKPEALMFKLRLSECEKWGCGWEGRDHEETLGWEKNSSVLGS